MFAFEFRETDGFIAEEIFVGFFQILLGVRQSEAIHILQKRELVFVLRRRIFQHLVRFLVVFDFVVQHSVVDKTGASETVCEICLLDFRRIEPEFVSF
ncbi:hypothetical protein SDC9_137141 [bioreactor metagenome]|uniref:Uncharacterized protein n=1 Tax=bioreactor metagenome TaxID=1076179 RepID=A0A645DL74_9ZZZZ